MSRDDDLDRDAHLRQALRHAPDADAAPPAALRELILREAQAKAREGRAVPTAPAPHLLHRLWAWIGTPRFAGALAGVMVIGFAGLLWRDRPPEEMASPSVRMQPAPAAPTQAPAVVPEAASPPSTQAADAESKAAMPPSPVTPAPAAKPKRNATPAPRAEPPPPPAPAPSPQPPVATGAAAPSPPPAFSESRPQPADPAREAAADAAAERRRDLNLSRSQKLAAAPAPAAPAARLAEAAPASLADLRRRIHGEATRWTWQRPGLASRPYDNAVGDWLGRAEQASRGRWQPDGAPAGGDTGAPAIVLLRNGQPAQRLHLAEDALVWEQLDRGERLRAPLDAATLAALRLALDALAP